MATARNRRPPPFLSETGMEFLAALLPRGARDESDLALPPGQRDTGGFWFPAGYSQPGDIFTPAQRRLQAKQRLVQRGRGTPRKVRPGEMDVPGGSPLPRVFFADDAAGGGSRSRPAAPEATERALPLPAPSPEAPDGRASIPARSSYRRAPVSGEELGCRLSESLPPDRLEPRPVVDSRKGSD